jgi:hypothetical protein
MSPFCTSVLAMLLYASVKEGLRRSAACGNRSHQALATAT